jgi:hypothetical protein
MNPILLWTYVRFIDNMIHLIRDEFNLFVVLDQVLSFSKPFHYERLASCAKIDVLDVI